MERFRNFGALCGGFFKQTSSESGVAEALQICQDFFYGVSLAAIRLCAQLYWLVNPPGHPALHAAGNVFETSTRTILESREVLARIA